MSKIQILILLIFLLFLLGCLPLERKGYVDVPEVHIGTEGLELRFFQRNLVDEVYEGGYFVVSVDVENKGAHDIDAGIYSLSIEDQYVELRDERIGRFSIRGKSLYNPVGEVRRLNFRAVAKELGPQTERLTTTITFNACYNYKIDTSMLTCVDTDLEGLKTNKVCSPIPESFPRGQGAPVAVTVIEPKMLPHEDPSLITPQFTLYVKNLGDGQVFNKNKVGMACGGGGLTSEDFNIVDVRVYLSDTPLNCRPTQLKLEEFEKKIVCSDEYGIERFRGTYIAPLRVELDYGYTNSISKQVVILRQLI